MIKLFGISAAALVIYSLLGVGATVGPAAPRPQEQPRAPATQDDKFDQLMLSARGLFRRQQFQEAIEEFKKAARLRNGQCAECYQFIGQSYTKVAKFKDAAAAFRQAVALKPENEGELQNLLGVAIFNMDDKKLLPEAAEAFKRAIELSGDRVENAYFNLGYALIKLGKEQEGIAALQKYVQLDPNSPNAANARSVIANPRLVSVRLAPTFRVTSTTGEEISLDRYKGRIVLLDFWATWCGPCVAEMPEVKKLWKKYGANDQFVMIGISLDQSRSAFENYVKKEGIEWLQYFDGTGWGNKISRLYGVNSIPRSILIDQEGAIRSVGLHGGELSSKIGELLKNLSKKEDDRSQSKN